MSPGPDSPEEDNEFYENFDPLTTDTPVATSKPTHNEKVQRGLGTAIVIAALLGYLLVVTFYLLDLTDPSDGIKDLATHSMSGLQTLAAAVVGFYFGSQKD